MHRLILVILFALILVSCTEIHNGEASASLEMYLEGLDVECSELIDWDFSTGFLVKKEMGGWAVLIISQSGRSNYYDLSLVSHGHERVFMTRKMVCE